METDYRNRMMASSHIREVGMHSHEWQTRHHDSRGNVYQECSICGTRRSHGVMPERLDWVAGGPWETPGEPEPKVTAKKVEPDPVTVKKSEPKPEPKPATAPTVEPESAPTSTEVRRMNKDELIEFLKDHGQDAGDDDLWKDLRERALALLES